MKGDAVNLVQRMRMMSMIRRWEFLFPFRQASALESEVVFECKYPLRLHECALPVC